ncbi:deoxyguanosinetriphosphate triphosphohydrolase [Rhodobium gokarnense]|uniref:Deoxyguanosinetriphosphate triphosphohydrolase-like protein n=1 Tax=Rhodobium gokarnense TaxID=364296 RepID=A0ABT3HFN6_9HYPH|nr:deoxyguanosinetriphosphate triphosphohydrolase [Rhodobium gokarnense]MCW2309200.1 dGTPase [Rhodobium gokarnense]
MPRYSPPPRAPIAADPNASRGRLFDEPASSTRTPFQRDRDRVIHSAAFRRLKHKTQVFVYHEDDHFRTRLTHSIEVAQIARSLARTLGLDEDLAEALALAHDLGHTPFGHEGEERLDECMAGYGGFDHNAQSLRIVTRLEQRYADFDGLNLTWETLEGLVKHNGPLTDRTGTPIGRYAGRPLPHAIRSYEPLHDLMLWSWPSAEAQIAAIADDIAYNAHDIDDGLRADLFTAADLLDVPLVGPTLADLNRAYPGLERSRLIHETVRRLIGTFVRDVAEEVRMRIARSKVDTPEAVRLLDHPLVAFSERIAGPERAIKKFLFERMYRHPSVMEARARAGKVARDLFAAFFADPDLMPEEWHQGLEGAAPDKLARRVCDYIAGMTDRYAWREHERLFDDTPELR